MLKFCATFLDKKNVTPAGKKIIAPLEGCKISTKWIENGECRKHNILGENAFKLGILGIPFGAFSAIFVQEPDAAQL